MSDNSTTNPLFPINGWEFDNPPTVTPFHFEKVDIVYWNGFICAYWHHSFYIAAFYLLLIFLLQRWMLHRPAFQLNFALFLWNSALALFSIVGFLRVSPPFLNLLSQKHGLYSSICVKKGINLPNVLWGLLFLASKVFELGDTIFLVLRKRPLLFIQYYHHISTLLVSFLVACLLEPISRWYSTLNFFVHGFVYSYFSLKTIGVPIPRWCARLITSLQFIQMLIGLAVNLTSYYLQRSGYPCARHPSSVMAFTFVYGTFIFLFGNILWKVKHQKSE